MIRVFNKFEPIPAGYVEVDTTSRGPFKDLSPFYLGPYSWWDDAHGQMVCQRFENLWQYSKVYQQHTTNGEPNDAYYTWRAQGFAKLRADRYPMGKGAKPLYSLVNNRMCDYVTARKTLYAPVYAELVLRTKSYAMLYDWVLQGRDIALRDFDGYDHQARNMTLRDVINNPHNKCGHAFVIYGLLTGELEEALK